MDFTIRMTLNPKCSVRFRRIPARLSDIGSAVLGVLMSCIFVGLSMNFPSTLPTYGRDYNPDHTAPKRPICPLKQQTPKAA